MVFNIWNDQKHLQSKSYFAFNFCLSLGSTSIFNSRIWTENCTHSGVFLKHIFIHHGMPLRVAICDFKHNNQGVRIVNMKFLHPHIWKWWNTENNSRKMLEKFCNYEKMPASELHICSKFSTQCLATFSWQIVKYYKNSIFHHLRQMHTLPMIVTY